MELKDNLDYEPKGRYYKIEKDRKGSVVLRPVKVPAHVIAERKEHARKREMLRNVKRNREIAASMGAGFIVFMCLALALCVGVCYLYISLQSRTASRAVEISRMEESLEESRSANDAAEKRIQLQENLEFVKKAAREELGMLPASEKNIIYYSVDDDDYMLQYDEFE
ncbi:MAG TPA: hypothetical protein IAA08_02990 [Candidatus Eubacterium avistercoris]|uniref:Cell division protein FtsL n=1 Tax=Candidatus Eubacterium avistercoris TaxID=2838567 RepID=A0A9D2D1I3_9FIRM|nr:hypothetical protein [Candidatus Eubacterium avistercoris]